MPFDRPARRGGRHGRGGMACDERLDRGTPLKAVLVALALSVPHAHAHGRPPAFGQRGVGSPGGTVAPAPAPLGRRAPSARSASGGANKLFTAGEVEDGKERRGRKGEGGGGGRRGLLLPLRARRHAPPPGDEPVAVVTLLSSRS